MPKIPVGIINVTGYVGAELARLLTGHSEVEIKSVTGRAEVGKRVCDVFPHLPLELLIEPELGEVELAFSALPHKASIETVIPVLNSGTKVVDTSADFRLKDPGEYPRWYDFTHPSPEKLSEAIYGLPELHRKAIAKARLVANPGCYPTCAILALAPAIREGIISGHIIIDSKSGVSGAGRALSLTSHYSEANENTFAYSLKGHRHMPEITQELSALSGKTVSVTFLPHLVPMTRGLLSSCYASIRPGALPAGDKAEPELNRLYRDFYRDEPFVKVVDYPPQTKHTLGSNFCLVHPAIDQHSGTLTVIACIDNLVKGAAGAAVQNMNLMLGLPETMALDNLALYP